MNWRIIKAVWLKELKDILRDKRTLLAMVIVPLLIYPLLLVGFSQLAITQISKLHSQMIRIAVEGVDPDMNFLLEMGLTNNVKIVEARNLREQVASGEIDAGIRIPPDLKAQLAKGLTVHPEIIYDESRDRSAASERRISKVFEDWNDQLLTQRLESRDLEPSFVKPLKPATTNVATQKQMSGKFVGGFLPYLVIIMTLVGALYPAMDLTAGEKERKTLETLLVTPATRLELVTGKYLTVFVLAIFSACLNLASMLLTFSLGLKSFAGGANLHSFELTANWGNALLALLLVLPLAVTFSALAMGISTYARTFREANNYVAPLMMACLFPAMFSLLPGIELTLGLALIPVINVSLLFKQIMIGNYEPWFFPVVLGSTLVYAWLAIKFAAGLFEKEEVLLRTSDDFIWNWRSLLFPSKNGTVPTVPSAILGFMVVLLLLAFVGGSQQARNMVRGLLFTEYVLVLGSTLLFIQASSMRFREGLNLHLPPARSWIAAVIIGLSAWILASSSFALVDHLFHVPGEYLDALRKGLENLSGLSLPMLIFVIAVTPAVCEEAFCRGYLLRILGTHLGKWKSIFLAGLLFGILHLDPYRLVPTALLGVIIGYVAFETGSILPGVLIHFLNNSLAVVLPEIGSRYGISWLKDDTSMVPIPVVAAGLCATLLGLFIIRGSRSGISDGDDTMVHPGRHAA